MFKLKSKINSVMSTTSIVCAIIILNQGCSGSVNGKIAPENPDKLEYVHKSYYPASKENCKSNLVKSYIGSENCRTCHNNEYKTWKKYFMSRFIRLRQDVSYIPSFNSLPLEYRDRKDDVAVVIGGRHNIAVVIKPWKVIPYQYQLKFHGKKSRSWEYRSNWEMATDFRSRCGQCHLTGLDIATLEFSELGVGCEACHGPGKKHYDSDGNSSMKVPEGNEACVRCHFQRLKHVRKFSFSGKFHK